MTRKHVMFSGCAALLTVGLLMAGPAMGQYWFEEDFDSYADASNPCPGVDPNNECGCIPSTAAFLTQWDTVPGIATGLIKHDFENTCPSGFRGWDMPFSYQAGKPAYRNTKDLVPIIESLTSGASNAVQGTTANPLVINFHMFLLTGGKDDDSTCWLELFRDDDPAPTSDKLIAAADCSSFWNYSPVNKHSSLAIGVFTELVPKEQCDNFIRELYQFVTFDGQQWILLKSNVPVSGTGNDMDVRTAIKDNDITVTIREDEYDLDIVSVEHGTLTRRGIPRNFQDGSDGPFQTIGIGAGIDSQYPVYIDRIRLSGGEFVYYDQPGACCLPSGACTFVGEAECLAAGGTFNGVGVSCDSVDCCPDPFADADRDGDVDQEDFGIFQACVTGGGGGVTLECECFDRHVGVDDPDIDQDDFALFQLCASGPDIPASITCDD